MSNAVVFGATGYAGSHILHELVSRGFSVTAISRSTPDKSSAESGVQWKSGSIHSAPLVNEVANGADVIVAAVPSRSDDGESLAASVPHLLEAAERAGARLAVVGGAGTLLVATGEGTLVEQPTFPEAFKPNATAHAAALEALRSNTSTAQWFYLSPPAQFGAAFEGPRLGGYKTGKDTVLTNSDGKSTISGADYALAFVDEISTPKHENERFTVAS
ncbi:NAD(P)H-binding protein [Arthrobacter sp. NPDC093128]|uniref:NAD(P)-dependent oxidoreductase n=1 Tax=Arthrobacter sp. NPDC093128 TaxID=3154979 RepID=UPI00342D6375